MKFISICKLTKDDDIIEIRFGRDERIKPSKFLEGGDAVQVLSADGRCITSDVRCMSTQRAADMIGAELASFEAQGWVRTQPPLQ
jgi:hypothetical protein